MLSSILLFLTFVILVAFFSSAETAFMGANPFTLDYLEKKGSKRAGLVKRVLSRVDDFLAAILIGNTLANVAAASLATYMRLVLPAPLHGVPLLPSQFCFTPAGSLVMDPEVSNTIRT